LEEIEVEVIVGAEVEKDLEVALVLLQEIKEHEIRKKREEREVAKEVENEVEVEVQVKIEGVQVEVEAHLIVRWIALRGKEIGQMILTNKREKRQKSN